jgi:hypothetical protein
MPPIISGEMNNQHTTKVTHLPEKLPNEHSNESLNTFVVKLKKLLPFRVERSGRILNWLKFLGLNACLYPQMLLIVSGSWVAFPVRFYQNVVSCTPRRTGL